MIFASLVKIRSEQKHFYLKNTWLVTAEARSVKNVANEFTDLITRINNAARSDRNLRISLTTTLAVHKPRIFNQGFDARGAKIGTYSTKPISISKNKQARNTGKTFFKGGYVEYKSAIGKNPGYVNLRNTDQMMMDYGLVGSNGQYGFGFQNDINSEKSGWMEQKYGKDIFSISNYEENVLADVVVDQLIKSL